MTFRALPICPFVVLLGMTVSSGIVSELREMPPLSKQEISTTGYRP
jgi:hypothetical protein